MKKRHLQTILAASLMLCVGCANNGGQTTPTTTTAPQPQTIQPGEQAPLADIGQKNFGGFQNGDTKGMAARRKAMLEAMNKIRTVPFDSLAMSDPFVYPDPETKTYYLTSSGGRMYKSKDLKMWEGPYNIIDINGLWLEKAGFAAAAEIHKIG
ncbi:MAG: hypothetical protein J6T70_13895, partial [Bacteroidales bacterium]|nr:hypothetical protein [Bacteroidales bacterium]